MLAEAVDWVLPLVPPYEFKLYVFLLRRTLAGPLGQPEVRIGKRTIASEMGQGTQAGQANYQQISKKLETLETLGLIRAFDTTRDGTLYEVLAPSDMPAVIEAKAEQRQSEAKSEPNHYRDADLRAGVFDRDGWRCTYCGDEITSATATLDHIVPVSKGGADDAENLAAACLICNSIKSGRTFEEAAPDLLRAQARRRSQD